MLNLILPTRIAEFRTVSAAVPQTAPDHAMDAATAAEFKAFDLVCRIPAGCHAGVAAKLELSAELVTKSEYATWGQRLAEAALEEMRVIQWNAEWRLTEGLAA